MSYLSMLVSLVIFNLLALLSDTYRSPSINGAMRKVNTGVQNIMADAFPRGTIWIAVNIAAKSIPPSRPCVTVRIRAPAGPR